jgi:phosphoribosyl 1,2-cyclic phosphodiesterase
MIKFCSLYSGSSGNSIFFSSGKTKILVDAGLSGKKIKDALASIGEDPSELSAILVTHEHIDHIRGVRIISREFGIPVYMNEGTLSAYKRSVSAPDKENFIDNVRIFTTGCDFEVGDILVNSFHLPHDAGEPVGFNLYAGNTKITMATDMGHITRKLIDRFEGCDLLFIESNHDIDMLKAGPYPWSLKKRILGDGGHLSNEMAGKVVAYLAEKGTSKFMLGHLSATNNFPELAYMTVSNILEEKGICPGTDISLKVADKSGARSFLLEL